MMGFVPYRRHGRARFSLSPTPEDTGRRGLWASQKESPHQGTNPTSHLDLEVSSASIIVRDEFLLLKPPGLWFSVVAAWAGWEKHCVCDGQWGWGNGAQAWLWSSWEDPGAPHSLLPGQGMTSVAWPPAGRADPDHRPPRQTRLGLAQSRGKKSHVG